MQITAKGLLRDKVWLCRELPKRAMVRAPATAIGPGRARTSPRRPA